MKNMKMRLILIPMLILALAACGKKQAAIKIGDKLPEMSLAALDGPQMQLPAGIQGKLTVILYWAEGCKYCESGMPEIETMYERLKDKGFMFLTIQIGGQPGASEELKKRFAITFPMLHDPKSATIKAYGIAGVPTMFLVDRDGTVREKILGGLEAQALEEMISKRL